MTAKPTFECKNCVHFNRDSGDTNLTTFREVLLFGRHLCKIADSIGTIIIGDKCDRYVYASCGNCENIHEMCMVPFASECKKWKPVEVVEERWAIPESKIKKIATKSRTVPVKHGTDQYGVANSKLRQKNNLLETENKDLKRQVEEAASRIRELREPSVTHRKLYGDAYFFTMASIFAFVIGFMISLAILCTMFKITFPDITNASFYDIFTTCRPEQLCIFNICVVSSIFAAIIAGFSTVDFVRVPGPGRFMAWYLRLNGLRIANLQHDQSSEIKMLENEKKCLEKIIDSSVRKEQVIKDVDMKYEHVLSEHDETPVKNIFTFSIESKKRMHPNEIVVALSKDVKDDE